MTWFKQIKIYMYVYLEKKITQKFMFEYQCNNQSSLKVQHKKLQNYTDHSDNLKRGYEDYNDFAFSWILLSIH